MTITAAVLLTTTPVSGSWHLYGLTNQTIAQTATDSSFAITRLVLQTTPSPAATLTTRLPDRWTPLTTTLASGGTMTTYTDTTIVGTRPRIIYRIRLIRL